MFAIKKEATDRRPRSSPPEKGKNFWTFFTQKQAVLPKENINNLGPSKASPHPESIKRKIRKINFAGER